MNKISLYFVAIIVFFAFAFPLRAEQIEVPSVPTRVRATISEIISVNTVRAGMANYDFRAKTDDQEIVEVHTADSTPGGIPIKLKAGEKIFLQKINGNPPQIYFDDVVRTQAYWWIAIVFILFSLVVGLIRGFWSLIGLGITLIVLFGYIFPSILHGKDILTVTIIGSIGILAVNMHIAHGFRRESFLAFLSTVIGFVFVWMFASLFSSWTQITGTGSEEAMLLMGDIAIPFSPIRLYLAGVILGAVGVLDDIAISQTEIVHELIHTDATLKRRQLFFSAMRIGRHHIASTINTLVLVYAGAAMPTLILFMYHSGDVGSFLNTEPITEEFVRTIAGTIALILTVPLSTLIATFAYSPKKLDKQEKHA